MMRTAWFVGLLVYLCSQEVAGRSFSIDYEHDTFLMDGKPFRYVSGSLHYTRVPAAYWKDRLQKMYAAGLNAVTTYVPWNYHELEPGVYSFTGELDLARFLTEAQEVGLYVILRPGPYTDAGWDFGGLPSWMMLPDNITVRTMDPQYIQMADKWLDKILPMVAPFLYINGGPIITVQVENEYGSYQFCDYDYLRYLRQKFRQHLGDDVVLFTTDGSGDGYLKCGTLDGIYSTVDFGLTTDMQQAFAPQRRWEPHGPLVCSEFYTGDQDFWGFPFSYVSTQEVTNSLMAVLAYGASMSMYMFAGGTTFGFMNGIWLTTPARVLGTSYDFDAPLTEAGDITYKYTAMRNIITKFTNSSGRPVPPNTPKYSYGTVDMKLVFSYLDGLSTLSPKMTKSVYPLSMEQVYHFYGLMLYRHIAKQSYINATFVAPEIRDRGYIMVDDKMVGLIMRDREPDMVQLTIREGQRLDILVENQGKVYFEPGLSNNRKGLTKNVTLNGTVLTGWEMYPLKLEDFAKNFNPNTIPSTNDMTSFVPSVYYGSFQAPNITTALPDTFVNMDPWFKGQLFINGINIGRYWPRLGPQVTLYVPGPWLRPYPEVNDVIVFELENAPCYSFFQHCTVTLVDTPIINKTVTPYTLTLSQH